MAIEACNDQKLMDDMDEDDEPLVFKRSSSSAKQNQGNSETKRPLSQKHDRPLNRPSPDVRPQNGQSTIIQKSKTVPSSRTPPLRSPLASPKSSNSSAKALAVRPREVNSNHASKGPNASTSVQKPKIPKPEDSDDEIPLSSKFQVKSNAGESTNRPSISGERKPLLAKYDQNGSASIERKPSTILKKRPAEGLKSAGESDLKKPKLSAASTPNKTKETSIKDEMKDEDDEDHVPISQRIKKQTSSDKKSSSAKNMTKPISASAKKTTKKSKKVMKNSKYSKSSKVPPSSGEGQKWTTLVHNGVIFPPPYKPHGVKMLYKGKPVELTPEQEEVATMYAVMLDTDYMNKPKFKENFMADWRKILGRNHVIQSLEHCDFTPIYEWHQKEKEKKKQMTAEEKKALKEEKLKQEEKYMWAIVNGVKEKDQFGSSFSARADCHAICRLETSELNHLDCSEAVANIQSWKEIRHDNTVTWLAYWNDPINPKEFKYVFLAASSTLKGQSDKEKYEKARLLKDYIHGIRAAYTKDFTSKDPTKKQIAVATYLIDKLALRAGNEKDDDEADTVGCCTLKVENVEPVPPNILKFDFLGKDSIRYQNEVEVETAVFKAIQQFRSGKKGSDDMFDRLDTSKLNAHLKELMPGLTAKVFRTYNASITLDDKVVKMAYMFQGVLEELQTDLARAKKGKPPLKSADGKPKRNLNPDALEKKIAQTNAKIEKMERDKETKEDLKTVALGTSKINYLDPRITVAWCKRHEVPIEKIFNKSLLAKFAWAMDVDPSFRF
ncbi:UNVERIFIED_CONTAM: DNA topoisomerase 1 alpha [Sesamum radiatum]|uniref:DNA topoisomerase I n=1 Tax=Sesamum radiatum TaxID=300843 RepID=A0AAW2R410_SESRA